MPDETLTLRRLLEERERLAQDRQASWSETSEALPYASPLWCEQRARERRDLTRKLCGTEGALRSEGVYADIRAARRGHSALNSVQADVELRSCLDAVARGVLHIAGRSGGLAIAFHPLFRDRIDEAHATFADTADADDHHRRVEKAEWLRRFGLTTAPEDYWITEVRVALGDFGRLTVLPVETLRPDEEARRARVAQLCTDFADHPGDKPWEYFFERRVPDFLAEHETRFRVSRAVALKDWRAAREELLDTGRAPILTPWAIAAESGEVDAAKRWATRTKKLRETRVLQVS